MSKYENVTGRRYGRVHIATKHGATSRDLESQIHTRSNQQEVEFSRERLLKARSLRDNQRLIACLTVHLSSKPDHYSDQPNGT